MRSAVSLVSFLLVIGLTAATKTTSQIPNPEALGAFPVGVTTTVFVDESRIDAVTKEARTLVTEIWYPATDDTRGKPKTKFTDFIPGGVSPQLEMMLKSAYKLSTDDLNRGFFTEAVRDAKVRDGRFPVVFFSHGNRGLRFQNTFWCDQLASHGYIVVSADHTGNAGVTIIKGKLVLYQGTERTHSAEDRPKDISFLIDQMTKWNDGGDPRFKGRMDLQKVAAAGMSFGSYTAIKVADADKRIKAVIGMAYAPAEGHTNLNVPTLLMLGEKDQTIGEEGNAAIRANFDAHRGPAGLIELKNGGHYSFSDMFKVNPNYGDGVGTGKRKGTEEIIAFTPMDTTYKIINSYSVAFLGTFLKGQTQYASFLTRNPWPEELEIKNKGLSSAAAAKAGN